MSTRSRRQPATEWTTALPPLTYRSVMVPLDGSSFAEHALPLALEIARRDEARVLAVHVASSLQLAHSLDQFFHSARYARLQRQRREYLEGVVRRLEAASAVPVTPILLEEEDIAQSLCEMAASGADLVVMATHGRGPLARFWRGRVADTLMRQLSVPVVLLRGGEAAPQLTSRPSVRRVLIPLDGSAFSEQVLQPAVAWETLTDAEYTLVQVLDPATADPSVPGAGRRLAARPGWKPSHAVSLWRAAERLRARGLQVKTELLLDADPTQAILRYARSHGTDLIALATWGRGGLSRFFRGSIADRLVRAASVPVLVFRPRSSFWKREDLAREGSVPPTFGGGSGR